MKIAEAISWLALAVFLHGVMSGDHIVIKNQPPPTMQEPE